MVIVRLLGGLGNQMFQYAAARHLARLKQTSLIIDVHDFQHDIKRQCGLDQFQLAAPHYTRARRILHRLWRRPSRFQEQQWYQYDERIEATPKRVYLDGYFQNESYFADSADVIHAEFSVRQEPTGLNAQLLKEIGRSNSVSIHIRRSDYASDSNQFEILPLTYYQDAIALIHARVSNPSFYIFSDDPEWAKRNFQIEDGAVVVDHNSQMSPHEDLRLMQNCQHNIIANSSFSWWAAWLNRNPDKIVFAPKAWIADEKINQRQTMPSGWIRL